MLQKDKGCGKIILVKLVENIFLLYLLFINVLSVTVFCADKYRAIKGKYRVPERVLWLVSLLGGATFGYLAMLAVRHKTKHFSFMFFMPLLSVLQAVLVMFILN